MRNRIPFALVLVALVATVVSAGGSSLIDSYTRRARTFQDRGYFQTHSPARGELDEADTDRWTITLQGGMEYKFFGACDEDCGDIDLTIYDESGRVVASDTASDDYPILTIRPRYTQQYSYRVSMQSCDYDPCAYMVGVFGRSNL